MNDNAKKWVEALRSGKYSQTKAVLHRLQDDESGHPGGYCCLGVACEVFDQENPGVLHRREVAGVEEMDDRTGSLPRQVREWIGLASEEGRYDGHMGGTALYLDNDRRGLSFSEIADIIESEPAGLFVS